MHQLTHIALTSALATSLLTGCQTTATPPALAIADVIALPTLSGKQAVEIPNIQQWLDGQPPFLSALVNEALNKNHNLAAQASRFKASKAQANLQGAARWPSLQINNQNSRAKNRGFTGTSINNNFSLGANLSWEADVWGRLSLQGQAATAEAVASADDYQAAKLSLTGNIIKAVIQLENQQAQLDFANRSLASFQQSLAITEDAYQAGVGNALDVRLNRANIANTESTVIERQRNLDSASRQLQLLLGRYPDGKLRLQEALSNSEPLTTALLPITLLERRPDLRAAANRLRAQDKRFANANKNLLPSLRFTASSSTGGLNFRDLFDWDTLLWNLLANISSPVFQGDRLSAERELADANRNQALYQYAAATQQAFAEMEAGISNAAWLEQQISAAQLATDESAAAEKLATEQYEAGIANILTLLETQRRWFNAQQTLLALQAQQQINQIDLLLALGLPNEIPATP